MLRRLGLLALALVLAAPSSLPAAERTSLRQRGLDRRTDPVGDLNATGGRAVKKPELDSVDFTFSIPSCTAMTGSGETMTVELSAPLPGSVGSAYEPDCPVEIEVEGSAGVGSLLSDIYFVIDTSGSTGRCSGSDIDGDGIIGTTFLQTCSDPDDSILAAEVKAVRDYVPTLSPLASRVAIIKFSAPGFSAIVQSLTSDFALVDAALDSILFSGPGGATDYGGALDLVLDEYFANGDPVNRRQFVYFMSDGVPTHPVPPPSTEEPGDSQWSIDHADTCASFGIEVHTFGIGFIPSVTEDPISPPRCVRPDGSLDVSTLECVALRTGGTFFASNDPAEIIDRIRLTEPAGIASVTIFNDTVGVSVVATLSPDGVFSAPLPVEIGVVNVLRVVVVADDGTTCELLTDFLPLCFAAGGCNPLTQGYWHRQCLGLDLIGGSDGRRGPGSHPDWPPQVLLALMEQFVDPKVAALGSPTDTTACEGLDADPQDDMCQKAIKQYTAVLMNMIGGRLGGACVVDLGDYGLEEVDPETAAEAIASMIQAGLAGDDAACKDANDAADLINTGAAVRR